MKIGILTRGPELYSTRRLVEAAEQHGHEVVLVNPLFCYMDITSNRPSMHYRGKTLDGLDAVIPRIGASITFYGTAVVRQFEMMGVYSVNESVAISRSRDKLRSLQLLARKGVGLPVTSFAHSTKSTADLIEMVGGAPLIVKLLEGTQGKGVVLAETQKAAESTIEAFRSLKAHFLVQEFIKEAGGADFRCFVVGDKVVAAMKRQGKEGEFRSNIHRGGSAAAVKITPEGAAGRRARGEHHGPERGRRRPPPLQPRPPRHGGELLARPRRHRAGDGARHRRQDHDVYREERPPEPDAHAGNRVRYV